MECSPDSIRAVTIGDSPRDPVSGSLAGENKPETKLVGPLYNVLSDAGSIPAASSLKDDQNPCFYRGFLMPFGTGSTPGDNNLVTIIW